MNVEPHDLDHEFPEFKDRIAALRGANPVLAALFADYDKVEAEVHRLEELDVPVADTLFEDLKKQRVLLKDQIYAVLRGQAAA